VVREPRNVKILKKFKNLTDALKFIRDA